MLGNGRPVLALWDISGRLRGRPGELNPCNSKVQTGPFFPTDHAESVRYIAPTLTSSAVAAQAPQQDAGAAAAFAAAGPAAAPVVVYEVRLPLSPSVLIECRICRCPRC